MPAESLSDFGEPAPRIKSKRTRIKEHRAKRNRRRFYVNTGKDERARDTGVRKHITDFFLNT